MSLQVLWNLFDCYINCSFRYKLAIQAGRQKKTTMDIEGIDDDLDYPEEEIGEDSFDPGPLHADPNEKRESEVKVASLVTNMDNNYRVYRN